MDIKNGLNFCRISRTLHALRITIFQILSGVGQLIGECEDPGLDLVSWEADS